MSNLLVKKSDKVFTVGKTVHKLEIHDSDTGELTFEDVFVPAESRLDTEGSGFKMLMNTFKYSQSGIAAGAIGCGGRVCQGESTVWKDSILLPRNPVDASVMSRE